MQCTIKASEPMLLREVPRGGTFSLIGLEENESVYMRLRDNTSMLTRQDADHFCYAVCIANRVGHGEPGYTELGRLYILHLDRPVIRLTGSATFYAVGTSPATLEECRRINTEAAELISRL